MATQTSTQTMPKAAIVVPLRTEQDSDSRIRAKAKNDAMDLLAEQTSEVKRLAEQYSNAKDATVREKLRNQVNRESMHLHGQLHVFWKSFSPQEQRELRAMQLDANKSVEKAAEKLGAKVSYISIADIKSSDGKSAGEHLYERLNHPDSTSVRKFIDSIEDEVLAKLESKGYDEYMFMRRLFDMNRILRLGKDQQDEVPAAQAEAEAPKSAKKKGDLEMFWLAETFHDANKTAKMKGSHLPTPTEFIRRSKEIASELGKQNFANLQKTEQKFWVDGKGFKFAGPCKIDYEAWTITPVKMEAYEKLPIKERLWAEPGQGRRIMTFSKGANENKAEFILTADTIDSQEAYSVFITS